MNSSIKIFINQAQRIGLTAAEKAEGLTFLEMHVRTAEVPRHTSVNEQQFMAAAKGISLSPAEKARSREFLLQALEAQGRPFLSWQSLLFSHVSQVMAAVVIVMLAGSGAVFASESALPGEILYPIKIHVTERLRVSFADDLEQQTKLELLLAQRRLEEAEALTIAAGEAGMDGEMEKKIAERFRAHAGLAHKNMRALSPNDPEKANSLAIGFEASLRAHSKVLEELPPMNALQKDVTEARMHSEETSIDITRNFAKYRKEVDRRSIRLKEQKLLYEKINLPAKKSTPRTIPKDEVIVDPTKTGTTGSGPTDDDRDDMVFGAKVRLQMTARELQKIRATIKERNADASSSIMEDRVGGTAALMDIATKELDSGNPEAALEASDAALQHARSAQKEMEAGEGAQGQVKWEEGRQVK